MTTPFPPALTRAPRRRDALALVLALAATALASPAAHAQAAGDRLVASGGSITEILYALGQQDRLVGVDTTSQFPPQALKEKASIGYIRALSAEGVLSLKPTLVLALEGSGPPDAVALIAESGVRIAKIPDDPSAAGVVAKIEAIGKGAAIGAPADRLAAVTRAGFEEVAALRSALPAKKRVLFVLSLQNGRVLVGGRNTTAGSMIAMAGATNAAEAIEGYKPMTDEAIIAAAPDAILMMRTGAGHTTTTEQLFALPSFSQTPAAKRGTHLVMDGLYLLGFGPRTPAAARDLMALIYPEAAVPALKTATAP